MEMEMEMNMDVETEMEREMEMEMKMDMDMERKMEREMKTEMEKEREMEMEMGMEREMESVMTANAANGPSTPGAAIAIAEAAPSREHPEGVWSWDPERVAPGEVVLMPSYRFATLHTVIEPEGTRVGGRSWVGGLARGMRVWKTRCDRQASFSSYEWYWDFP